MTAWPPTEMAHISRKMQEWDAWLSGDRAKLEGTSAQAGQPTTIGGRVVRAWKRFWGYQDQDQLSTPKIKVHVPLAADIARGSADMLFGEPPTFTSDDADTKALLEDLVKKGLVDTLASAAEIAAGIGGTYLRAVADTAKGRVFATRIDYDAVVPTFAWGELVAATCWHRVKTDGSVVWWHLEHHELVAGIGVVRHELWQGTPTSRDRLVPLTEAPATAGLAALVDEEGRISTETPGLAIFHVPNIVPNMLWRDDPIGCNMGAADIAGAEDQLDRLDHNESLLAREADLAKARMILPTTMLNVGKAGDGAVFDSDREFWVGVADAPVDGGGLKPELVQPEIRVEKFLAIKQNLIDDILRRAGYSTASFGEDDSGSQTATEVRSKNSRSGRTRGRKLRIWQPAVDALVRKLVAMHVALIEGGKGDPEKVTIAWPPSVDIAPVERSTIVTNLFNSQSADVEQRVKIMNPDWTPDQIKKQVASIKAEFGMAVEPPDIPPDNGDPDPERAVPDDTEQAD